MKETKETVSHHRNNNQLREKKARHNPEGKSTLKKKNSDKFAQLLPVLRAWKPGRQTGGTVYCLSRFLCIQRPATSSATPLNHRESLFIGEL